MNDSEILDQARNYLAANLTSDPDEPIDGSDAVDILITLREILTQVAE